MADLTKDQLKQQNETLFANNNSGNISAEDLRTFNNEVIDTLATENNPSLTGSVEVSGSVTADTFFGDGSNLTGVTSEVPSGTISGSSQVNYPEISNIPSGIVSSSSQVDLSLATGVATSALTASLLEGNATNVQSIDMEIGGIAAEQRLSWNDTAGTLDVGLKGGNVTLQVGQELVTRVVNKTGVNLTEAGYQVVKVLGAQGNRLSVALAQADADLNSASTLGLVTENIPLNQEGFITTEGLVRGINTTGTLQLEVWNEGDILYLSGTTPGGITNVKPDSPTHLVTLGYVVTKNPSNGSIFVKVDNGYELEELHDVLITSASNGDILKYNSALSLWENVASADLTGSFVQETTFNTYTASQEVLNTTFATTGSNTFVASQTIQSNDGLVLQNNIGTGDVVITPGPDFITKFDDATIIGINIYGGDKLSGSWGEVGNTSNRAGIINANVTPSSDGDIRLTHGTSYTSLRSNGNNGTLFLRGDVIEIQGSSSLDSGVSLTVKGSVSASSFDGDAKLATTGSNTFDGDQIINGVSTQNNTAPNLFGENAFVNMSGASIGGRPYNRTFFGVADYSNFGLNLEDYFAIEYYDSFGYNFGSEFNVNGKQINLQTAASGSGQLSYVRTTDNYDGTSQVSIGSGNKVAMNGFVEVTGTMDVSGATNFGTSGSNDRLGVYGGIILRSGSGISTDGAFGPDVPFDSPVSFFNGATFNGSNLLMAGNTINQAGDINVTNGDITLSFNSDIEVTTGSAISFYENGLSGTSALRFHSGSDASGNKWINIQPEPTGNGRLAIASFPENNHFMFFDPKDSVAGNQRVYIESTIEGGSNGGAVSIGDGLEVTGSVNINGNSTTNGVATQNNTAPGTNQENAFVNVNGAVVQGRNYNRAFFGMADYPSFGKQFEDYFSIEYYDSFGYNYGSEFAINGSGATIQTVPETTGYGGRATISTVDNYDGTADININARNGNTNISGQLVLPGLGDYADDAAAATGGVPVNGVYRTGSVLKIRVV